MVILREGKTSMNLYRNIGLLFVLILTVGTAFSMNPKKKEKENVDWLSEAQVNDQELNHRINILAKLFDTTSEKLKQFFINLPISLPLLGVFTLQAIVAVFWVLTEEGHSLHGLSALRPYVIFYDAFFTYLGIIGDIYA